MKSSLDKGTTCLYMNACPHLSAKNATQYNNTNSYCVLLCAKFVSWSAKIQMTDHESYNI